MQLVIKPCGDIAALYAETLDFQKLGAVNITRGSHVEPDANGQWLADLSPVSGPVLGPFHHRSQALEAERRWLERHWLTDNSKQRSASDTKSS